MLNVDFTFLFVLLNFLILFFIVRKFFFGRIGEIIDKRAEIAQAEMRAATESREQGDAYLKRREDELAAARAESAQYAEDARRHARLDSEEIIESAKFDASAILATAREQAARERAELDRRFNEEAVGLVIMAASKVIEENMDNIRNRELVEEFLRNRGAA